MIKDSSTSQLEKPSLLVVDDNDANLLAINSFLKNPNYNLIEARSGAEALKILEKTEVALILLDVQMPEMDGFTAAKKISALPNACHTPIIFLTAATDDRFKYQAYAAGAIDFIEKPLDENALSAKVNAFIRLYQNQKKVRQESEIIFAEKEFLFTLLENLSEGIVACNAEGELTLFNSAARNFYGQSEKAVSAEQWSKHYNLFQVDGKTLLPKEEIPLYQALTKGKISDAEMVIAPDDQPRRHVRANGQSIFSKSGQKIGAVVVMRDITELKMLEAKRLELEQQRFQALAAATEQKKLHRLFQVAPGAIAIFKLVHQEFIYEYANPQYEEVMHRKIPIGSKLFDIFPDFKKDSPELYDLLLAAATTGDSHNAKDVPVLADWENTGVKTERNFTFNYEPLFNSEGQSHGVMTFSFDVTDQVLARKKIIESEERLKFALSSANMGTWSIDLKTNQSVASEETLQILGVKKLGSDIYQAIDQVSLENDRVAVRKKVEEALQDNTLYEHEFRIRRADQEIRWVLSRGRAQYNDSHQPVSIAGVLMDITDQKRFQSQLQTVLDTIPIFAGVLKPDGRITLINNMALRTVEKTKAETIGKLFWEGPWWLLLPDAKLKIQKAVQQAALGIFQKTDIAYDSYTNGKYSERCFDLAMTPVFNDTGNVESITISGFDITDRVHLLKELETAKVEAERANHLKSAFLANMSHEIRTPLGAMMGFADLLRDTHVPEDEKINYIDILIRNGEQLSYIINDILDLSKVEAGHLTLELTSMSPDQIACDVVSLLQVKANEKNLKLEYTLEPQTPAFITSDPTRVRQVLLNLVTNAIKFTPTGTVKIRCFAYRDSLHVETVCFEIQDTGIGISTAQREHLFEAFVQGDGSVTRRFGGTGLGLALSKRLALALGGDVILTQSEIGHGATFWFILKNNAKVASAVLDATPAVLQSTSAQENRKKPLSGVRVLVVDDAPDNQKLIWHYLTKQGALVDSAENGFLGYQKALAGQFDLILMDLQMPEMDGFTATEKLRAEGYKKPIIALTAHAMAEVRKKCLTAGCTDHLTKPINPQALISTIMKYTDHYPR